MLKGVHSEVGRLRKVLVCRPGLAQKRLTPANCHELLFDDVLWVAKARNDHDAFTSAMIERGVEVLEMHDLLAQTVSDPAARAWLLDRKLGPDFIDPEAAQSLRPWLEALPPARLAEHLIGGLARAELPFAPAGLLARCVGPSDLLLPPLPNTLFTRDSSCWIGNGVVLCPMFWPARRQETLLTAAVYRFHPAFRDASGSPPTEWWGDPDRDHGLASLEGGDVMPLGSGVVLVYEIEKGASSPALLQNTVDQINQHGRIAVFKTRCRFQQCGYSDASLDDGVVHVPRKSGTFGQQQCITLLCLPRINPKSQPKEHGK